MRRELYGIHLSVPGITLDEGGRQVERPRKEIKEDK